MWNDGRRTESFNDRPTGIEVIGNVAWGTHFCHFYETVEDLPDILVPYFKSGLEANELCVWVVEEPLPKIAHGTPCVTRCLTWISASQPATS